MDVAPDRPVPIGYEVVQPGCPVQQVAEVAACHRPDHTAVDEVLEEIPRCEERREVVVLPRAEFVLGEHLAARGIALPPEVAAADEQEAGVRTGEEDELGVGRGGPSIPLAT